MFNKLHRLNPKTLPLAISLTSVLALVTVAYFANVGAALLITFVGAWMLLFATAFRTDAFLSFVYGLAAHFVINILTFVLALPLGVKISWPLLVIAHAVAIGLAWLTLSRLPYHRTPRPPHITLATVTASITFIVTYGIMVAPFLTTGGIGSFTYLSTGEDNISHFALHNSVAKNHSLLYSLTNQEAGVHHNLKAYPHGYHANLAANSIIVYGNRPQIGELTKSHILQIVGNYALLSSLVAYLITAGFIGHRKITTPKLLISVSITVLATYFGSLGFLLYLFTYGFHTQIAASSFLLILLAAVAPSLRKEAIKEGDRWLAAIILSIVTILTAYTWYFLLPVVAGFGVAWIVLSWKFLKANRTASLIAVLCSAVLAFIPIAYDTFRPHDSSSLLLPGAIWLPQPLTLLVAVVLLGVFIITHLSTSWREKTLYGTLLLLTTAVCFLFTAMIGAYMMLKIGRLEYYFYKSEYELLILTLVSIGYSVGIVANHIKSDLPRASKASLAAVLLVFSTALCITLQPLHYTADYTAGKLPTALHDPYLQIAINDTKNPNYYINPACRSYRNYITQRWIQAVKLNESREQTAISLAHIYNNSDTDVAYFNKLTTQAGAVGLPSIACDP